MYKNPVMKKSLLFYLVVFTVVALTGCSKKQDSSATYSMEVDINGGHFSAQGATNVVAVLVTNPSDPSKKQLTITGTSNSRITIVIPNYSVSQSTYMIDIAGSGAFAYYSYGPDVIANSGTLTITQSGYNYIGSFRFSTAGGITASNGIFTAKGS